MPTHRRQFLLSGASAALTVAGCRPTADAGLPPGGFVGPSWERGHALRDATSGPGRDADPAPASPGAQAPAVTRRVHTLIAGGGVAGLAAARALRLRGMDDFALLELEDQPGGNARTGQLGGLPCPLGAHYLPVPGDRAPHVQHLLEELGLRQRVAGRWVYDERHLCHSPQERLYFQGQWQAGLLPVDGVGAGTLAQYRQFAHAVRAVQQRSLYAIPISKWPLPHDQLALDAFTFGAWLTAQGLTDPHLRWYLDYCCRDDYGAGLATVSAWAGLHYFASRHGFTAPGDDAPEAEPVLTWPQGNGWLTTQLAAPLGDRLRTGQVVRRIEPVAHPGPTAAAAGAPMRHNVAVLALNTTTGQTERWLANRCIVALPIVVAARVVVNAPAPVQHVLQEAARAVRYAPWVVTNLYLKQPLADRGGAAPAWDNVVYQEGGAANPSGGLGYVSATHQNLHPLPGPTVITHYRALGDHPAARQSLLAQPWTHWCDQTVADLQAAHPELPSRIADVAVARYGHAMAMPVPGFMTKMGLYRSHSFNRLLLKSAGLGFAHSDWAGYSVFEEAFTMGHVAGGA
ncbi:MAG: FAD-dependent oxidoreductase [Burkholderiales bacterium]|nr:FAD-dependent oxidoreductase [Burkholderiales bacterium]